MSDNIIEYIKRREEERSKLLKEEQQPVEEEVVEVAPVKTWEKLIKENKVERLKQESKISIDFKQPFELEKLQEIALIEKINDIIKFRDPVLEKMEYREWVKILQNKMVDELDPGYAKKLYEQDMSRVEKYDALSKKSGGGRNRVAVTVEEDPFTPADLLNAASPDGAWFDSTDATKNTFHSNNGLDQWDVSAGKTAPLLAPNSAFSAAPTTFPNAASTRGFSGAAKTSGQTNSLESQDVTGYTLANGNPWTVGWVLHIPQAVVDETASNIRTTVGYYNSFSIGYRTDTDTIWADQRSEYDQFKWIRKTGITAGTYIIIGTQDGTSSGLKLYVNGVDQGVQNAPNFGNDATGFRLKARFVPDVILGDLLVMERALTSDEVAALNTYWTTKFI